MKCRWSCGLVSPVGRFVPQAHHVTGGRTYRNTPVTVLPPATAQTLVQSTRPRLFLQEKRDVSDV